MKKNFSKNEKNSSDLDAQIREICTPLIYISEADSSVEMFRWSTHKNFNGETIIHEARLEQNAQIEEVAFDDFFLKLTKEKDWFGEPERERAAGFLKLQNLLSENLTDLKVFRIGQVRIEIFVVGLDQSGETVGVRMSAVET